MRLILASGSPRRRELLEQIGVRFEQVVQSIDETPYLAEPAEQYVQRMALEKALAVANLYPQDAVLAADTTVVLANKIFAKPIDENDAAQMLRQLSRQTHQVLTAVCLIAGSQQQAALVSTSVQFNDLTDEQIQRYIATGEPMDKAGAYAIQGKAAVFVKEIHGCYSNVVGLPLAKTAEMLHSFNIPCWQ